VSSLNSVGQSSFTRAAGLRSVGEEVRALQKFLNVAGFTVALAGPGSFGRETNVFGAATRNALMQFQKANGIDPTGYFGPLTRAAVNASLISSVGTGGAPAGTPNTPSTPSTGSANNAGNNAGGASGKVFTRSLATGNTGNDVKTLQKFLNTRGFTIAQTGPGSPGRETTVFGDATQYQLRQFQKANGIPATGFFGPQTKAKIEALMKR
jgi:peptidoglycan hydrolase-like protein with peptidoglycan-binding domain